MKRRMEGVGGQNKAEMSADDYATQALPSRDIGYTVSGFNRLADIKIAFHACGVGGPGSALRNPTANGLSLSIMSVYFQNLCRLAVRVATAVSICASVIPESDSPCTNCHLVTVGRRSIAISSPVAAHQGLPSLTRHQDSWLFGTSSASTLVIKY